MRRKWSASFPLEQGNLVLLRGELEEGDRVDYVWGELQVDPYWKVSSPEGSAKGAFQTEGHQSQRKVEMDAGSCLIPLVQGHYS